MGRHSVFGELFHESPRTRRVYTANSQNRTKNCLTETCLERGSRDKLLGDGNLLEQYVGTCELNKCIKRHSPQKKQKNKKTKKKQKNKKNKKTKKQKNKKTKKQKKKPKKQKNKKTKKQKNKKKQKKQKNKKTKTKNKN